MLSSTKRVLLVEDSRDIQCLLIKVLEGSGYLVDCAHNGKHALEILRTAIDLPGVIMLDLMMPEMDGYEFRMHQLNTPGLSKIPVVVMTAESAAHNKIKTLSAQGFLKKPFKDIESILDVIEKTFPA